VRNFEFYTWVKKVTVRAEEVEAEPPAARAPYPRELKVRVEG